MPEVQSEENRKAIAPLAPGHASTEEKATTGSPSPPPTHTRGAAPVAIIPSIHHNPAPISTTKAEPTSQPSHLPTHSMPRSPTTRERDESRTFAHGTSPPASHVPPTVKPSSAGPETHKSSPVTTSEPSKQIPTTTPRFITSRTKTLRPSTETQRATKTRDGSTFTHTITTTEAPASTSTKKGNPLDPCSLPIVKHVLCPQKTTTTSLKTSTTTTSRLATTAHETTAPNQTKSAHKTPGPTRKPDPCSLPIVDLFCPPKMTTKSRETSTATTDTHRIPGPTSTHSATDHTTAITHQTSRPTSTSVHQTLTTLKHTTESSKATSDTGSTHPILQTGRPTLKPGQPVTTTRATTAAPANTDKSQKPSATANGNHSDPLPDHPTAVQQRTTAAPKDTVTLQVPSQHPTPQGHDTKSSAAAEATTATTSTITINPSPPLRILRSTLVSVLGTASSSGSESSLAFLPTAKPSSGSDFHLGGPGNSKDASPILPTLTDSSPPEVDSQEITASMGGATSGKPQNSGNQSTSTPRPSGRHPVSEHTGLSTGDIVAISVSAAVVCLAAIGALLVFLLCRHRRKRMSKAFDPGHSTSPSHGSVAYLPVYSAVPVPDYQTSTHTLPVLPKTEATPRHDPRALSMYAYTAQVEKAPADGMTSYNAVYNTSNDRASVSTHSKSASTATTGTLYETAPIQNHPQNDYLREPQDPKRVASLTGSIASSNVHYGVAI